MKAIADSGFIVALAIKTDRWHVPCLDAYRQHQQIFIPQTTLAEVAYLLGREGGNNAVLNFLSGLPKTRYEIIALEGTDIERTKALLEQYKGTRLDFVDLTIMAVAERLDIIHILTIDKRDFQIVRPQHIDYFELFP